MRVTAYSFGNISINGAPYTSDVIVFQDRVNGSWWRKQGHYLQPADLEEVVAARPQAVVIGTGHSGMMQVPSDTVEFLERKGIEVHVSKTGKAVDVFNRLAGEKLTVGAFHITC